MARYLSAVLAVLHGLLSCAVLGRYSTHKHMLLRPNFFAETTICRSTPGLSRPQMELCFRQPDVARAALQGLQQAVVECQHQFQDHRWNCSSLSTRSKNPYNSAILQRGYRETAFVSAISSAGVVLSVARACSTGTLLNCDCDTRKYKVKGDRDQNASWKRSGCGDLLHFGIKFSRKFLDSRENGADIHSEINLHNNHVGRMAVAENMQQKCKCHGVSGSCVLKTCFKEVPTMRTVGEALKAKYRTAVKVEQSNVANSQMQITRSNQKRRKQRSKLRQWAPLNRKQKRGIRSKLIFYEKSPDYCESDQSLNVWGTAGRLCNNTLSYRGDDSCSSLCCGKGYAMIKRKRTLRKCHFHWCCTVKCENCTEEEYVSICK